jgi:hybrid cluster-associated redox disulfide protein
MDHPSAEVDLTESIEVMLGVKPQLYKVFILNRMGCIGCAFSKFHTLLDACEIYQLDKRSVLRQARDLLKGEETQA